MVRLPLASVPSPSIDAAAEAPGPTPVAPRRRVLVVEDNRDAAESLAALLELEGHDVRIAVDALAALETAGSFRPDVVLSDLGLPGMDGFDFARALRSRPALGHPILVALSGYGRDEDRRRSREAGYDHYLVKPPDLNALMAVVGGGTPAGSGPADDPPQLGKAGNVP